MNALAAHMPLLARQEGIWEGVYRCYDYHGKQVDEHASKLTCRLTPGSDFDYHQSNEYRWADGRTETREFKGRYRDGRLWFEDGPIDGWAAEDALDRDHLTMLLQWRRKDEPSTRFYEMIQVDDACRQRSRVWQWIRDGRIFLRTLIDEHKVADDWR